MKRLLASLAIATLFDFSLSSCGNLPPIKWPEMVKCAPGVSDLVGVVSRILLADGGAPEMGDRAKDELNDLGRKHGGKTVSCMVERLVHDWSSPGASQEPSRVVAAARGRAFLDEVGTDAVLPPEESGPTSPQ